MPTPDRWKEVSPYLDQALTLPDSERADWVAFVRTQNPEIAALLDALLDEHRVLAEENFLEGGPAAIPLQTRLQGQTIGAYTLVSEIGRGGMGSIWLAERTDGRFERKVAVKFLRVPLATHRGEERFKREGKLLASLAHPHIAELIDAGVSPDGQPYLVIEYVEGEHIDCYCDHRALGVKARVRLFIDVLEAVSYTHNHLIVHRDIKPSNVLVR